MRLIGDFGKLEINILSRSRATDYWDGNWLYVGIVIFVPSFTADYKCNLRTDEFATFYENINALLLDKRVTTSFSSMEEGLVLKLEKDITGIFTVTGEAKSNENYNNILLFEFTVDLSQLELFKSDINTMLQQFPVKGT